jgi:hypothetical protein
VPDSKEVGEAAIRHDGDVAEKIKYIGSAKICKDQEDLRLKPVDRGVSGKHFVNCIVRCDIPI